MKEENSEKERDKFFFRQTINSMKKINVKQRSSFTNQLFSYSYTSRSINFQTFREVSQCPIKYNPHLDHTSFFCNTQKLLHIKQVRHFGSNYSHSSKRTHFPTACISTDIFML